MTEHANVTVEDNSEENRYEALDESGVVAGFAAYERRNGLLIFTHTEVDDAFEGRGVGSTLVRGALDDASIKDVRVRILCPFVKDYIEQHPEYQHLLHDQ